MIGALNIVLLKHVTTVHKDVTSRTMPMILVDVVVKIVVGEAIRSALATHPMARAHVLVVPKSVT